MDRESAETDSDSDYDVNALSQTTSTMVYLGKYPYYFNDLYRLLNSYFSPQTRPQDVIACVGEN
jgi:hypothetical protein